MLRQVLIKIQSAQCCTLPELADACRISARQVTDILEQLSHMGYVDKEPVRVCTQDCRGCGKNCSWGGVPYLYKITAKGRAALKQ